jgi:serine/threonine-protein kinase HipA
MADRVLEVRCFDERAGTLTDTDTTLRFEYDDKWRSRGMPPLSQSLPLEGTFSAEAVSAFFGGLLPEGEPRKLLSRQLGVSTGNDFSLLDALGGDTAGAISLLRPGEQPKPQGVDVHWLDDRELAHEIAELPTRPMHVDADGEYRLSLAGVQDKLPVVVGGDGRVGLTKGSTPSTHILKTPIAGLDHTVANEACSLTIGARLGIPTVEAQPHRLEGVEFLLVRRYDRMVDDDATKRLHQEDFCQALGIPAERKYQNEGGPGLADLFAVLRRSVAVPARDAPTLLSYVALNFLVANHDAHGKNYSLLYPPRSDRATLAPAYDVLSTIAYRKVRPMSRRMAMSIGGEYRPDYVRSRHLDRLFDEAGLGPAAARRLLRGLAAEAPGAARAARDALAVGGWNVPVLDRMVGVVDQRATWLAEVAAPAAATARRR